MRPIRYIFICISMSFIFSCTNDGFTPDTTGFSKIEQDLKSKFGANSFYTDFSVKFNSNKDHEINVTVTKAPSSLKMKGFRNIKGHWKQTSEVTLELGKGNIENYMFTLNEKVSVAKIGKLIEASIKKLEKQEQVEHITFNMASVTAPNNGDKNDMLYHIQLKSLNNVYHNFWYDLDGEFCQ